MGCSAAVDDPKLRVVGDLGPFRAEIAHDTHFWFMIAGLLLAAGAGRRMGRPKALVRDADGTPWVRRATLTLIAGGCDPVLVVLGAAGAEAQANLPAGVRVVHATDWAEGMGASLRAGLAAAGDTQAMAVLVSLVDTPGVTPEVIARVCAAADGPGVLARAAYAGEQGHPVLIGREHWAEAARVATGDRGARELLARPDVRLVECGDLGDGADVDHPQG